MIGKQISKYKSPMVVDYHPELEDSDNVLHEEGSQYRVIIGSLNWAITLGRFDIQYATTTMARYSMAPKVGHMQAVQRILGYLKKLQKIILDS